MASGQGGKFPRGRAGGKAGRPHGWQKRGDSRALCCLHLTAISGQATQPHCSRFHVLLPEELCSLERQFSFVKRSVILSQRVDACLTLSDNSKL